MLKLSTNLRKIISERDLTVAGISRKSGVPKTNIQGWLDGASPNIVQLAKVAHSLGLSIETLAFEEFGSRGGRPQEVFEGLDISPGRYEVLIRRISSKGEV